MELKAAKMLSFLLLFVPVVFCGFAPADPLHGTCVVSNATAFYEASTQQCRVCDTNKVATQFGACVCDANSGTVDQLNNRSICVVCAAQQMTRNPKGECLPCGSLNETNPSLFNVSVWALLSASGYSLTVDDILNATTLFEISDVLISSSEFDTSLSRCACPPGSVLIDSIGSISLGKFFCATCNGMPSPTDPMQCIACEAPFVEHESSQCICGPAYVQMNDGTCALRTQLDFLMAAATGGSMSIPAKNVENRGVDGKAASSYLIETYLFSSGVACLNADATACNLLANLCVLSLYDPTSAACSVYLAIQSQELCRGFECEKPTTVPWLYYMRGSPLILLEGDLELQLSFSPRFGMMNHLQFVLSTFSWNGTWLGNIAVVNQLDLCDLPSVEASQFFDVGVSASVQCELNLRWFLQAPETTFFELYLVDQSLDGKQTLKDVPVLTDYGTDDINPRDVHDEQIVRGGSISGATTGASYKRRFYLYDNIGTRKSLTGHPEIATFARRILVLVGLRPDHLGLLYKPLLIVQYASVLVSDYVDNTDFQMKKLAMLRTNVSGGRGTLKGSTHTLFTGTTDRTRRALMIILIILCCLCFFTAWVRTYGWMRRQQDMLFGFYSLIRWFIYYCNHLSNTFTIVTVLTALYFYVFFKFQSSVEVLVPQDNRYLFTMLYIAFFAKLIYVVYRIWEQANADIFVIDWERPKTGILKDRKDASVTMWRSTFIANEFNELQTYRLWNPLLCIAIIMVFLEGLDYIKLGNSVPDTSSTASKYSRPHPLLRLAIGAFFWIVIPLPIYFVQHYIFYRFVTVHPLRAFTDLCSVSNISILVLLEPLWGFYIHGESIHAHADASLEEFQENLKREAQGNLPQRGLGGQDQCQTFEVFIGWKLRQFMNVCYTDLWREYLNTLSGSAGPITVGHHRRCFEFITGGPGQCSTFSSETLAIKRRLNDAFIKMIRGAESTLMAKFPIHSLLDFPPNLLFMNGPFAGENNGKDLFFTDSFDGYARGLLAGLDMDIFVLGMLVFLVMDSLVANTYIAFAISYFIDSLIVAYRGAEGEANLGSKTLFDERFFL